MYFDAHTHLQFAAFDSDWKESIRRALDAGVWLVNVGTQKDTSRRAVEVAHEFREGVYAAVGLHPIHTEKSHHDADELGGDDTAREFTSRGESFEYGYYKKLALDPKVVAIGECGLDYYRLGEASKKKQEEAFLAQIELAKDVGKPLMIHCRNAFSDLTDLLHASRSMLRDIPGILHFFSGTAEDAKKLLDMGFYFTFGGAITFPPRKGKSAGDYDAVIRALPVDRILSETDAPYVAPVPYRGKRNESLYVVEVVRQLAALKGISEEEMAEHIRENARRVLMV